MNNNEFFYRFIKMSFAEKFYEKIAMDDYTYFTMAEVDEILDECYEDMKDEK